MRKNKTIRSLRKKTSGTRQKPKPVDPVVRAKRRAAQAERAPQSDANAAGIVAIEAGKWPEQIAFLAGLADGGLGGPS